MAKINPYVFPHKCIQCGGLTLAGYSTSNPSGYRWGAIHRDCFEALEKGCKQSVYQNAGIKICDSHSGDDIRTKE